jgi:endogenous inhibitor of DNA gyrase (YacG/DUF329 family)
MKSYNFVSSQLRRATVFPATVCGKICSVLIIMPIVKCPSCLRETEFTGNEFRPFCSERCKLLDFGAWADEEFRLPTQETALSEEDLDQIEKALNEREKSN